MYYSKLRYFYLFLLLFLSVQCDKTDLSEIPSVYLDFSINIQTDVQYYNLQNAGSSQEITASSVGLITLGYNNNGIIIFNNGDGFYAFDRTCPHDYPTSIAVSGNDGNSATCSNCNSVYIFSAGGWPSNESISSYALTEYTASYNQNTGVVRVYN